MKKYYKEYDHVFFCIEGKKDLTVVKTYRFATEITVFKDYVPSYDLKKMTEITETEFKQAYKKALKTIICKL